MKNSHKVLLIGLFAVFAVALSASLYMAAPRLTAFAVEFKQETESSNPIDIAGERELDTGFDGNLSSKKVCEYVSALSYNAYDITVNYTESTNWETEDNNTSDKADEITCNTPYYGNLSTAKDVDWYKFNLSADCEISISFLHDVFDDDRTYWFVYLLKSDPFLDEATHFYVYGNSNTTNDFTALTAGVYYIRINHGFYHSPLTYSFTVNVKHDHVGVWTVTTPPTCISSGTETKICTVCGHTETREVPITEHIRDGGKIIKKTTIFQVGEIEYTCTFCGEKEIVKDKSKVWVLPVVIAGAVLVVIGLINYVKMMRKK